MHLKCSLEDFFRFRLSADLLPNVFLRSVFRVLHLKVTLSNDVVDLSMRKILISYLSSNHLKSEIEKETYAYIPLYRRHERCTGMSRNTKQITFTATIQRNACIPFTIDYMRKCVM